MNNNINLQKINDRFYLYLTQSETIFTGTILAKSFNGDLGKFSTRDINGVTYFIIKTFTQTNIFTLTTQVQEFVANFEKIEANANQYDNNNIKAQIKRLTSDERYDIVADTLKYNIDYSNGAIERLAKVAYLTGYELIIRKRQEVELNESFEKYIR